MRAVMYAALICYAVLLRSSLIHAGLDKLSEVFRLQPPHLLKSTPELASFVDIDLTSLLTVCLPKLLSPFQTLNSSNEDPSLARQVCCTVESEIGGQSNLVRMEKMYARIFTEVDWSTFPFDLQ